MTNTAASTGTPTTYRVTIETMSGFLTMDVLALDYRTAHFAACEQYVTDPDGTVRHAINQRLMGLE